MKDSADIKLVRLLQLSSPALPVGAFSYSQGLESAVDAGIVRDAAAAQSWIGDVLEYSIGRMEAPSLARLIASWRARDFAAVERWNALFLASRETSELRAETLQMGYSLRKLILELVESEGTDEKALARFTSVAEVAFPTSFAFAVVQWEIPTEPALVAYLWAWLENQMTAAVKLVPLGQTEGQRLLVTIGEKIPRLLDRALSIVDDDLGCSAPHLAMLSSRHETQYSRLFRS